MSEKNLTDVFVETLFTLKNREMPPEIELEARKCLMDEIATILAGAVAQKERLTKHMLRYTRFLIIWHIFCLNGSLYYRLCKNNPYNK